MMEVPVVEVHLSNILQREPFRSESYVARAARGIIAGFGGTGYRLAVDAINDIMVTESRS
jgi:3-dehydroquinate dehydratase-2